MAEGFYSSKSKATLLCLCVSPSPAGHSKWLSIVKEDLFRNLFWCEYGLYLQPGVVGEGQQYSGLFFQNMRSSGPTDIPFAYFE